MAGASSVAGARGGARLRGGTRGEEEDEVPLVGEGEGDGDGDGEGMAASPGMDGARGKVGWVAMALILMSDQVGYGILSVPKAFANMGWAPANAAVVGLFLVTTYTGLVLAKIRRGDPALRSYRGLFARVFGARAGVYAGVCVNFLLFAVVCGSVFVQAEAWGSLFPHACSLWMILVAGAGSVLLLQVRSMPNIGFVSALSLVSILIPNVIVLRSMHAYGAGGVADRTPAATAMFGNSLVDALVSLLDIVFAFAGHLVFFELMAEMTEPDDFSKALWLSQVTTGAIYVANGSFIYANVGNAAWLKSPITVSLVDGPAKRCAQVFVIAHISMSIVVDGTVFIRAVQRALQPWAQHLLCPCLAVEHDTRLEEAEEECAAAEKAAAPAPAPVPVPGVFDFLAPVDDVPHAANCAGSEDIATPTDWSARAVAWWAVWSTLTVSFIAVIALVINDFDDIIGLTAALIASQTSISWPALVNYWCYYRGASKSTCALSDCGSAACAHAKRRRRVIVPLDVSLVLLGIALFVGGLGASASDIWRRWEKLGAKRMFSCK